ncbi:MAG: hypothetical protein A3I68_08720 [Candidatus Melainabacteria bacterium RIFCSPLOWO2_02_FULL_35_15]|nr:MAG: hypothetical protein A3F80_06890 [Candidatus Melainabacteria bacterium RIFCSPLOWO2_12_FULL_35_11]OGI14048.1 MAG: hypothetical protein A3I68_08720 [Candidatus Melainabacteria bacterium RIFCSPLOWO2_02_FULL_35_15]
MTNAYLSEIYSAIQGEGPLTGIRQIFARFSICDLHCIWCDTPESLIKNEFCTIEKIAGTRTFHRIKNPININDLLSHIKLLSPELHHSISLTGGEPLLYSDFLNIFLPRLKKEISLPVYLESGGHRPKELNKIINFLDYISMDFKLPSSANTGILWDKHKEFLEVSAKAKNLQNIWIKIVITNETLPDELIYSINLIKSVYKKNNPEIFLQPVTKTNSITPPDELELLKIQKELLNIYPKIRVIPQVHRLIGQM